MQDILINQKIDDLINTYIIDAYNSNTSSLFIDYSTRATGPSEDAHGIVWKVEVNGNDAQDEYAFN